MACGLRVTLLFAACTLRGSSERPQDVELALGGLDSRDVLKAQDGPSLKKKPRSDPRTAHYGKLKNSEATVMDHYFDKWKPRKGHRHGDHGYRHSDHGYPFADRDERGQSGERYVLGGYERTRPEQDHIIDLNTNQILKKLGDIYDPQGGVMDVRMKAVKMSDGELRSQARQWVDKSHEAIKATHHAIVEAANDAQKEFMQDGLRLDEAIRDNFQNETAKMSALSIDPSVYNRIHLEVKARRELPPPAQRPARKWSDMFPSPVGEDKTQTEAADG